MKKAIIILCLIIFGCETTNEKHPCVDYQITITDLESEIEKQFQENGNLKRQLERAEEYIQLLERENDTLKTQKYGK